MKDVFTGALAVIAIPLCFGVIALVYWFFVRGSDIALLPAISLALFLLPLFLPIILFYLTHERWIEFVREKFLYNSKRVTLRIKLPQEVFKSPEAMESVFTQIFAPMNPDNFYQSYIDGKHKIPISLELASIGGEVRFYMNVPQKLKNITESQLYSQYPGIEVEEELLDYASELQWDPEKMDLMAFHITKKEEAVFPIKTYVEFGHDRIPKEEEKFEPMAAMIEYMSTAKPHERVYIQMICTPHAKENFLTGSLKQKGVWTDDAKKKINDMMKRDDSGIAVVDEEENQTRSMLTTGERDTISAIERNVSKAAYDVGIRGIYVALDKEQFNPGMIAPTFGSFTQFSVGGRNALGPRWKTDFDHSWYEDVTGKKKLARKEDEVTQFKLRKYWAGTGKVNDGHQSKTMSVEELATIFHIPGSSVVTPGLSRIASKRQNAPGNLPVGELPF